MKKLLNKLSTSGNLREETHLDNDEHIETHIRKNTSLPTDPQYTSEAFKMRKSFSSSKATSPRYRQAMEKEDLPKKKSSTGIKKDKEKEADKLHESGDRVVRKSFSMRAVSLFKSSDQLKNNPDALRTRSPSLKSIFMSQGDLHDSDDNESATEEDDAFVPHDTTMEYHDHITPSTPTQVPSRTTPSPPFSASPSSSPSHVPSLTPPSSRIVPFTQSPPTSSPSHHVVVAAEEFDLQFVSKNDSNQYPANEYSAARGRNDSITDDYGTQFGSGSGSEYGRARADSTMSDSSMTEVMQLDSGDSIHHKKGSFFSFGQNKARKLKS